jgi:hypothetical protein
MIKSKVKLWTKSKKPAILTFFCLNLFADVTPEDYVIEQVARRFLQDNQHRPFNSPGAVPGLRPNPEFTYRFPEHSSSTEKTSPFAVSPSDPRYYEDTQSLAG